MTPKDRDWLISFYEQMLFDFLATFDPAAEVDDMDRIYRQEAANAWLEALKTGDMDVIQSVVVYHTLHFSFLN